MRPLSMQFTARCSSRNKPQLELSRPCSSSSSSSNILVGGIILPIDLSSLSYTFFSQMIGKKQGEAISTIRLKIKTLSSNYIFNRRGGRGANKCIFNAR